MRYTIACFLFFSAMVGVASNANASSPTGWSPVVLPTGAYRSQIQAMPIEKRPGRLLHVYGNTVRLIDQAPQVDGFARPVRQIFLGTTNLRKESGRTTPRANRPRRR